MNRAIKTLIILIIISIFCSCTRALIHADSIATFSISGNIIDNETKIAIEGAQIYFNGEGLQRMEDRKYSEPISIGESNIEGKLHVEYLYFWSTEYKELFNGSWKRIDDLEDNFDIIISKKGYKDTKIAYKLKDLTYDKNTYYVFLNNINLIKEH